MEKELSVVPTLTHPGTTVKGMKGLSLRQDWHCPRCKVAITTFVTVTEPPTHRCQKAANQYKPLQEKEQKQ